MAALSSNSSAVCFARETCLPWRRLEEGSAHRQPARKVSLQIPFAKRREPRQFWMARSESTLEPRTKTHWFPYKNEFNLDEKTTMTSEMVIETLGPMFVDERKRKFEQIIASRTFTICPVVEGLFDIGNICAVFRSAEAFGLQSVHVIANSEHKKYKEARNISMGAEKWLDVEVWDSTGSCIKELRDRGYRIAVTDVGPDTVPVHDLDWTVPTAVIFGNEQNGISDEAHSAADLKVHIPMVGMVDSFNVSVAAGIFMYHVVNDRLARSGAHGDLTHEERRILCAEFYLRNKRNMNDVVNYLLAHKKEQQEVVSCA